MKAQPNGWAFFCIYSMKKISAIQSLTLFHGTDAKFIPSIIEKGILSKKPTNLVTAIKAVYLAPNVERAAAYTDQHEHPIVLEITISSHKRTKLIQQDALDREDGDNEPGQWEEAGREFERYVKQLLNVRSLPTELSWIGEEPEKMRGNNLYRCAITWAKNQNIDLQTFKQKLFAAFPPNDIVGEIFEIAPDGTVMLTDSFHSTSHQLTYPKDLPAVTIKAVWAPAAHLPPGTLGKEKRIGKQPMIGLIDYINETVRDTESYKVNTFGYDSFEEQKEDILMNIEVAAFKVYLPEFIRLVEAAKNMEEIRRIFESWEPLRPGEILQPTNWMRIPIDSVETLRSVAQTLCNAPPSR